MHLKRLEIQGFKSFAQKTTLEFSQGVIAIVGPNGSGKSNVADSLRWVLGEQSAKLIRGKKSDDVIFAGSEKKVKMGFAEVIATFDNRDHRIPVDASEVSIGRRIDRSGESEYLINGNKVRLLDIVDLVLKSNIGTSRYTVIGQGTIDQMILQGPAEVKNLLDEASGVKNYYLKREKTLRRLEQTAQNLMRAEDLIAEIEPRLRSLRRQAKRMEARAEIEQELKLYQREFFGKTHDHLQTAVNGYLEKIAVLDTTREDLEKTLHVHRQKMEEHEKDSAGNSGKFSEIQNSLSQVQSKKNKLLEDLSLVRGKMQSYKTAGSGDAASLSVDLNSKLTKIAETEKEIAASKIQQEKTTSAITESNAELSKLNQKLENLYQTLQSPGSVDWAMFDRELVALENTFENFYNSLQTSSSVAAVVEAAGNLKTSFSKFTSLAKNSLTAPQINQQQLQAELKNLQNQKEQFLAKTRKLELDFSKSHLSLEFLEKELRTLSQEKLHLELELKKSQSSGTEDFLNSLVAEEKKIQNEADALAAEIGKLQLLFTQEQAQERHKQKDFLAAESEYRKKQDELSKVKDRISELSIEKAKYDTQMEVLAEEVKRLLGEEALKNMTEQKTEGGTPGLEEKISRLKNQLDTIGGMDELTLKEYQETEARYTNLNTQVADLKQGMGDLRSIMDELDQHIKTKFNEAFHKINEKFEYYFRVLFNGGRAYLSVVKSEDELPAEVAEDKPETDENPDALRPEEKVVKKYEKGASNIVGIDMKATPPGKKLASIQALSGGERALTSIALLCSLLTCFPSPFVVLDEVDAALDDANTIRFGQILGSLAHQTQFITITHNRETMAQAGMLYGVTMGDDGISKLLSVKLDQAKQFAK